MKYLILIVLLLIFVVTAQVPTWVSVLRSPTSQNKNSKNIGCRSILPGSYKNIECITNWIEEQLNSKATPEYALCQTFRLGADFELPQDVDGSWGPLGSYYQSIRADTYDNAVAAMLLINANKLDEARKICDAFVLMVEFDKAADGRTRTAYSAISPINRDYMPNRAPTFGLNIVDNSVTTSSMAYMILALTRFYIHSQDYKYLRTAIKIASSIDGNLRYDSEWGGYAGGFTETNGLDLPLSWRSVVHNNDVFAAARMLYGLTGDVVWQKMMTRAQNYVKHMYDTKKGFYYMGNPPISPPQDFLNTNMPIAADAQTWNALSDVDADWTRKSKSLQYVMDHLYKTETQKDDVTGENISYEGILYSNQGSAIQFEQTASAAMAFYHIGKQVKNSDAGASTRFINAAKSLVQSLLKNQQYAVNGDGHGIVASVDPNGAKVWAGNVFEGSSWTYYPVQHTAASAWTGLALYYIMFDDEYANPYSEYYKKPIPKFFGATITSATGASGMPPRKSEDPESFAIGTAGLVVASIFAVFLVAGLAIMALLNVRLVRKNYRIIGGDEAATGNTVILSPIRSMNTPNTPVSPTHNSPMAVNSPANEQ